MIKRAAFTVADIAKSLPVTREAFSIYKLLVLVVAWALTGCKEDPAPAPQVTGTRTELSLDSIFLYTKETYLWNSALPDQNRFDPRSYLDESQTELKNFQRELLALTSYAINPTTNLPYEHIATASSLKYSFMTDKNGETTNSQASITPEGTANDYGFAITAISTTDLRVRYVTPGSQAAAEGMERSDRILTINGQTVSAANQTEINKINKAFLNQAMAVRLRKRDNSTRDLNLTLQEYTADPVYKSAILNAGTKKVGYLNFGAYTVLSNAGGGLDDAFATFASAGATALIIDLRYNGGGYVETANYLIELIGPSSLQGSVLYSERYNTDLQQGKTPMLEKQYLRDTNGNRVKYNGRDATLADVDYSVAGNTYRFSKRGPLDNISKVVFITTGNTASASELTMEALTPYLDVKRVGSTTYGKPVGFFGITIDKYTLYVPNFEITNAQGEGGYYSGLTPDIEEDDDVTRNFGDASEACIAAALAYIKDGTTGGRTGRQQGQTHIEIQGLESFKGTIGGPPKLK
jgi:carboxyl-terminal processing protease